MVSVEGVGYRVRLQGVVYGVKGTEEMVLGEGEKKSV
jgi:hypothetical protein